MCIARNNIETLKGPSKKGPGLERGTDCLGKKSKGIDDVYIYGQLGVIALLGALSYVVKLAQF